MKRGREDGASSLAAGKRGGSGKPASGPISDNKPSTNDALGYLREVRNRFSDDKDIYDAFLETMKEFKASRLDALGVIRQVRKLFKGHRELILGFNTFLPKGFEIELAKVSDDEEEVVEEPQAEVVTNSSEEFGQAITYVNKIKNRFSPDEQVYKTFLEILNMYRKQQRPITFVHHEVAVLFRDHPDLLEEFQYFLPDNSQQAQQQPDPRGRSQRGANNTGTSAGAHGMAAQPALPTTPADARSGHKRKAARKAEEGFKAGYASGAYDHEMAPAAQPGLPREFHFFDRVKQRLRNREAYQDLLKVLNLYIQDVVSRQELMYLAHDMLGKHPDLMTGFLEFVGKMEVPDADLVSGAMPNNRQAMQHEMERQKQLHKDKYMTKPLSEIVGREKERVTPSYVRIPSGYPKLSAKGRTALGMSVLNETFVNVITGSEDYSFKLMRKNQYEEALFRCEDDRYQFEICIETNFAALKLLRPIIELSNRMTNNEERNAYQLEEGHALHAPVPANAIARLYGDQGTYILELLRKHPAVVAPVVGAKMEAKDAEWRKIREDMTKTWKKIYELNYHKSLDHRSFYFKQAEKKNLFPKAMVAEVREAAEQMREAEGQASSKEENYRAMLCPARRHDASALHAPHLSHDYSQRRVFDDCWSVLHMAILETSGGSLNQQVMKYYLEDVEPFFGLPVRSEELGLMKEEMRAKKSRARGGSNRDDSDNDSSDGKGAGPESTPEPGADTDMDIEEGMKRGSARSGRFKREDSGTCDGEGVEADEVGSSTEFECCTPLAPYSGSERDGYYSQAAPSTSRAQEAPSTSCSGAAAAAAATTTTLAAATAVAAPRRLMLGNEMILVFFMFHRHLFERLCTARRCSLQQALQQRGYRQFVDLPPDVQAQVEEVADSVHALFMGMVQQLMMGELETVLYEDQVRALLGSNSYELFTIDKLLNKLVGHMKMLVQDEQTGRLLELFKYERSRSEPRPTSYYANSLGLLEDASYQIQYRDDDSSLTIQLLERERADAFTNCEGNGEGPVTEYISSFVSDTARNTLAETGRPVYLARNLTSMQRDSPEETLLAEMKHVATSNGLECKVSCSSNKVNYVLDTEDMMYRPQLVSKKGCEGRREFSRNRFRKWLEVAMNRLKAEEEAVMALAGPNAMGNDDA